MKLCLLPAPCLRRAAGRSILVLLGASIAALPVRAADSPAAATRVDPKLERWLRPQEWRRDSDRPILSLGEKGRFDDTHIFAPHVIRENGEYSLYYCGSQRCVEAGTYRGTVKSRDHRLFKLGLARSKDGVQFSRHSKDPVFSFGDDIHSVLTPAILKNPDGSVCRENGRLRMYFAACDFPGGTYEHNLYETTSTDGVTWSKPTLTMKNAYAPCVIKEGGKYRMWYTWINKHPWQTSYAESDDGTNWKLTEKPCIVLDQPWEVKDQVYPMVIKTEGVYVMIYGAYWKDELHTAFGFAVSADGLNWTKNPSNPVFTPKAENDWESNFTTSQTLLPWPDGGYRLWYAARTKPLVENGRITWTHLYYALGTARWAGPEKPAD